MRIIVISDLHIGTEMCDVDAIYNFFNSDIIKEDDLLIICGDMFDLWISSVTKALSKSGKLKEVLSA